MSTTNCVNRCLTEASAVAFIRAELFLTWAEARRIEWQFLRLLCPVQFCLRAEPVFIGRAQGTSPFLPKLVRQPFNPVMLRGIETHLICPFVRRFPRQRRSSCRGFAFLNFFSLQIGDLRQKIGTRDPSYSIPGGRRDDVQAASDICDPTPQWEGR